MSMRRPCVSALFLVVALTESANGRAETPGEWARFRRVSRGQFVPLIRPKYISAAETRISDSDRVLGVVSGGDSRCYPLRQLWYHHVVNDEIGGQRLAVTYCSMANTAVVFRLDDP